MGANRTAYELGLSLSAANRHLDAIEQFEQALAQRPDDPKVLFALGNTARALGMPAAAQDFFSKVLVQDPGRLEALVNLSNLLQTQGQFEAAVALIRPALTRKPKEAELWLTLGSALQMKGDERDAEYHLRQALSFNPTHPVANSNLADILCDRGQFAEALDHYNRALESDGQNHQIRLNRAILHLSTGNLIDGWHDYAARLQIKNKAPVTDHGLERWNGKNLSQKRLLVTAEQGIGDQIMFASQIPELAAHATKDAGSVILECEPRLRNLFARSFPDVCVHEWNIETTSGVARTRFDWLDCFGGADAAIEMGSLAQRLRSSLTAFPKSNVYLKPHAMELARWNSVLDGHSPFVGICWRSAKMTAHRAVQYAPIEVWANFVAKLPGTVVCAQYDAQQDEIDLLARKSRKPIFVPPKLDQKNDLDATAGLLASLDAVVSAPTAVSWLSAAVGTETFKVVYDKSWTSFGQSYEPFAPACSVMMPSARGDWRDVFDQTLSRIRL